MQEMPAKSLVEMSSFCRFKLNLAPSELAELLGVSPMKLEMQFLGFLRETTPDVVPRLRMLDAIVERLDDATDGRSNCDEVENASKLRRALFDAIPEHAGRSLAYYVQHATDRLLKSETEKAISKQVERLLQSKGAFG